MKLSRAVINPQVVSAKYAVRGALAQRAEQIKDDLARDPKSHKFPEVTFLNIGNPQQLDQKPLTFVRQVLSLVQYPQLIEARVPLFPRDALDRAKFLLKNLGSVGAYSHSKGIHVVRESVARFIEERDGFPSDPENIFLSAGASSAAEKIMTLVATDDNVGIMVPVPQYPLYSATSSLVGTNFQGYYLDEEHGWATSVEAIKKSYDEARAAGVLPRLLVVINPGNPTGAVLTETQIGEILAFAKEKGVIVLADEVYQANIFHDMAPPFTSFKKVRSLLAEQDPAYNNVPLVSLHSTSKGFFGECGQRGGYMEVVGCPEDVMEELYKLASIELCPVVTGQITTEIMVNPPKLGDPSYDLYHRESNGILNTLHARAEQLYNAFKDMDGVTCQRPRGAMYLFPQITVPPKAQEAAKEYGVSPDAFYAMALLNETGICVVPGSGFGQRKHTLHFRTTFLAPGGQDLSDRFVKFHNEFMKKYS